MSKDTLSIFKPGIINILVLCLSPIGAIYAANEVGFALEEVVVTARKREESLMDTPVSITAFTADELSDRQIDAIDQVAEATPNVVFRTDAANSGNSNVAIVYIRGIGQSDFVPTVEPGVGIYLDNTYISQTIGAVLDVVDVESVQVLRGPQGTLFGRNTIGGAILLNTVKPNEEFGGNLEFIGGSYDRLQGKGAINIPITDNFFARASFMVRHRDGHVDFPNIDGDDGGGSDDTQAGRLALRWKPSDSLTIDASLDYTHSESDGTAGVLGSPIVEFPPAGISPAAIDTTAYNLIVAPLAGLPQYTNAAFGTALEDRVSFGGQHKRSQNDIWGVNLNIEWDVGALTIKSLTSYREVQSEDQRDSDHSPIEIIGTVSDDLESSTFSQEIQVSGRGFDDRLQWLVGAYYAEDKAININPISFPFFGAVSGAQIDNFSAALFTQGTYDVTEQLSLTLGLRYTKEEKDSIVDHSKIQYVTRLFEPGGLAFLPPIPGTTFQFPFGFFPPGTFNVLAPAGVSEADETELDPYVNIGYQWNDDLLIYASYSEGFKGGGFVQRVVPGAAVTSFNPESATVYEAGFKWDGFDRRLRLTGAGFFTDYTDLQVTINRGIAPVTENAGDAEIYGFELEATIVPTPAWLISGGVGYLDAEYTKLDAAATIPITNRLPSIPDWQLNASAAYTRAVPGLAGSFTARVDWSWTDDYALEANNIPLLIQDSYHVLNASLTYVHESDKWEVAFQGRNITDELYLASGQNDTALSGYLEAALARPAEWNVKFKYRF